MALSEDARQTDWIRPRPAAGMVVPFVLGRLVFARLAVAGQWLPPPGTSPVEAEDAFVFLTHANGAILLDLGAPCVRHAQVLHRKQQEMVDRKLRPRKAA